MRFRQEVEEIAPFLPANFTALPYLDGEHGGPDLANCKTTVIGTDEAGWTQEDYVKPRLASGLIWPIASSNEMDASTHLHDAILSLWMHGVADEASGDVEAPTGHFFRVARWIQTQDERGNGNIRTFSSEAEAKQAFQDKESEFALWDGEGDFDHHED